MAYTSGAGETCERYPSNNLAVLRVRVDGGLFSVFFEDGAHPQTVLGSFDPLGGMSWLTGIHVEVEAA